MAGLLPLNQADHDEVTWYRKHGKKTKAILGTSKAMDQVRELTKKVAAFDEPVLILGPTGCGKELVARAIRDGSNRKGGPFLPINCAVLSGNPIMAQDNAVDDGQTQAGTIPRCPSSERLTAIA